MTGSKHSTDMWDPRPPALHPVTSTTEATIVVDEVTAQTREWHYLSIFASKGSEGSCMANAFHCRVHRMIYGWFTSIIECLLLRAHREVLLRDYNVLNVMRVI
jgi:hypothetical protein